MDWHVPLSLSPQLYGIAVNRNSFGAELIRESRAFIVNFVPAEWEETILFCGRHSGRVVDKFEATGLVSEEAETVDAPRLAHAVGFLECEVQQTFDVGDHTLFVGLVKHAMTRDERPRLHFQDAQAGQF
jgi:flavin reductase (DIM6/NTAB) family NADH-FMN oxidoreductase RutF